MHQLRCGPASKQQWVVSVHRLPCWQQQRIVGSSCMRKLHVWPVFWVGRLLVRELRCGPVRGLGKHIMRELRRGPVLVSSRLRNLLRLRCRQDFCVARRIVVLKLPGQHFSIERGTNQL